MVEIKSIVKDYLERAKSGEDIEEIFEKGKEEAEEIKERFNAYITVSEPSAERKGKLYGALIAVKDNICTKGIRTTAGSKILEDYVPEFDATCVERVKQEGGAVLGKTAMDEFGFGTFSTNCAFGIPKNPLDANRSCGGSSGGAACAVAASKMPVISIAESTGGSITAPAAFTGTVGLTPTYGRVSRWGLIDYANSLDKIGVIGRSTYDVALLLSVIGGRDPKDTTSSTEKVDEYERLEEKRLKVGIPKEYFEVEMEKGVEEGVWNAIKKLEREGVEYKEISLPSTSLAIETYYIISMSEASTNLAKYCGLRYGLQKNIEGSSNEYFSEVRSLGFGEEAKRRIILGTYMRMAGYRGKYYEKALRLRTRIINEFKNAFENVDIIATPSMPILAPRFEDIEKLAPEEVYSMDIMTVSPNLAGLPTLSIPCSKSNSLPVGIQFIAKHFHEKDLLDFGYFAEGLFGYGG
ncbi:MAG: Asp-tRNA(Asn)/Glu-tRNA(Gln) amidotransferase subunit GatA [Candidatus Micrarchaeaceae archaeon]